MSITTPIAAGQIKKGMFAILRDRPCKVINVSVSKTGKHGHAKASIEGIDVFTDKKYIDVQPTTHTMMQPVLVTTQYDVIHIEDDGYMCLLGEDGQTQKENMTVPDGDLGNEIQSLFEEHGIVSVTVLSWGEEEAVKSVKKV